MRGIIIAVELVHGISISRILVVWPQVERRQASEEGKRRYRSVEFVLLSSTVHHDSRISVSFGVVIGTKRLAIMLAGCVSCTYISVVVC